MEPIMTHSNLDLAHECGGVWRAGDDEPSLMCFTLTKLNAFAERIRAEKPDHRAVMRQTLDALEKFCKGETSGIPASQLVFTLRQALEGKQ